MTSDSDNSNSDSAVNPFAPPEVSRFAQAEKIEPEQIYSTTYATLPKTVGVWTVVCSISAIPGFIWGFQMAEPIGMILGVITFIIFYIGADYLTRRTMLRENRKIRRTLQIGYWFRLVISIIFPIGMTVDLYAGMIAILVIQGVSPRNEQSLPILESYLSTLVTGVFINIGLTLFMLAVLTIWWLGGSAINWLNGMQPTEDL